MGVDELHPVPHAQFDAWFAEASAAGVPTPEQMGFGREIIDLMSRSQGLLLVTGPTGSGKSTTLASLMNHAAQKLGKAISTVEQPIEYQIAARNEPPVSIW